MGLFPSSQAFAVSEEFKILEEKLSALAGARGKVFDCDIATDHGATVKYTRLGKTACVQIAIGLSTRFVCYTYVFINGEMRIHSSAERKIDSSEWSRSKDFRLFKEGYTSTVYFYNGKPFRFVRSMPIEDFSDLDTREEKLIRQSTARPEDVLAAN